MTARVTRADEAPAYHPPLHTDVQAKRLQGHEAGPTERFWVGESLYIPGGLAERSPAAEETVYVVLEGDLDVTLEESGTQTLTAGDSIHLPKGTIRSVENTGTANARLLVIIATPNSTGGPE